MSMIVIRAKHRANSIVNFPVYQEITEKTGTLTGILGVRKNRDNRGFLLIRLENG